MSEELKTRKLSPNFMAIDLELNQRNGNPKIIEIGYAVGNIETQEILECKSFFVDPNEVLVRENPDIVELCNIWREADGPKPNKRVRVIPTGASALEALLRLIAVHAEFNCQTNAVVWGSGDMKAIREQIFDMTDGSIKWPFGRREIDVKTLSLELVRARGGQPAGGLARTMKKHFGLSFEGRKHEAHSDALNTLRTYFAIHHEFRKLNVKTDDIK